MEYLNSFYKTFFIILIFISNIVFTADMTLTQEFNRAIEIKNMDMTKLSIKELKGIEKETTDIRIMLSNTRIKENDKRIKFAIKGLELALERQLGNIQIKLGTKEKIDWNVIIDGKCKDCEAELINFFSSKDQSLKNLSVVEQNLFLIHLSECFDFFSKNTKYYENAINFIQLLKYNSQIIKEILQTNPVLFDSILTNLKYSSLNDQNNWSSFENILLKYIPRQVYEDSTEKFIKSAITERKEHDIKRIFNTINIALNDSITINENAKIYGLTLPISGSRDVKVFLNPLLRFINSVEDDILLRRIFLKLTKEIEMTQSPITLPALKQLFSNTNLVNKINLANLLRILEKMDINDTKVVIHTPMRSGEKIWLDENKFSRIIKNYLVNCWEQELVDSIQIINPFIEKAINFKLPVGARIKFNNTNKKQLLHIFSNFSNKNNKLYLSIRFVDDSDGIILGIYDETFSITENDSNKNIRNFIMSSKENFLESLSGYKAYESFINDKSIDFFSFDQFKAYQLTDVFMTAKRTTAEKHKLIFADGIFISDPIIVNKIENKFNNFQNILIKKFHDRQSILTLPVYSSNHPSPNSLFICGTYDETRPKYLIIHIKNKGFTVLNIELEFTEITDQELYYSASFVVESVESLLGLDSIGENPAKINSIVSTQSLIFPGMAQINIAENIRPYRPQKYKNWGKIYLMLGGLALTGALITEKQAFEKLDKESFQLRNNFLIGFGLLSLTSFIDAFYTIRKHNDHIKP